MYGVSGTYIYEVRNKRPEGFHHTKSRSYKRKSTFLLLPVSERYLRHTKVTPTIMLKGQWLKELGFDIGDYGSITCENGKLVITPDTERAAIAEVEVVFMEREMESDTV